MANERQEDRKRPTENTGNEERFATGTNAGRMGASTGGYNEWSPNWDKTKRELRNKYTQLTDNDLDLREGRESELLDRVGQRLGKTPDEARRIIQESSSRSQTSAGERTK